MNHGKGNFGAPQCLHLKCNGEQCRLPAMRHKRFCHFHNPAHERARMPGGERFRIPTLKDTPSIQGALTQVMRALVCNQIDTRKAGVLLYALQLCSTNLNAGREAFAMHMQAGQPEESILPPGRLQERLASAPPTPSGTNEEPQDNESQPRSAAPRGLW